MQFIIHVSCVIVNRDNKVLVVQEKSPASFGKYNLPGGHLELGEKIAAGAKREVREEVNLQIEPQYLVGIFTGVGKHHFMNYVFYAETHDQDPEPQFTEVLDCKWMSIDEIMNADEDTLLNPTKLKSIVQRVSNKTLHQTDLIMELF